ncbi:MAG: peptidyl-prolyl cis-trans isomerase, partial [bacterium]|nr:peptidyl-prolyl cis-trans isomerase [bacterium]
DRIIRKREEIKAANEYVKNFMTPKNVVVKADAINFLVRAARQLQRSHQDLPDQLPHLMDEELHPVQREIMDRRHDMVVEFDGGSWDIETFFEKLNETMPADWPDLSNHLSIAEKLAVMVRNEFLFQQALKLGLDSNPDANRKLNQERDRIVANLIRHDVAAAFQFDEADYQQYYQTNRDQYYTPQKLKIGEIVCDSLEHARDLMGKLATGTAFADLAATTPASKPTSSASGEIGYINSADHPDIASLTENMEIGQIADPVLIGGQYRIIQLLDRKPPVLIPYQEIAAQVRNDLTRSAIRDSIELIVLKMKQKNPLSINYELLKALSDETPGKPVEMMAPRY